MKKGIVIMALVALVVFGLSALTSGIARADTVKIAFIGAFTGPAFKMTKDAEQAAVLAVEKISWEKRWK